MKLVASLVCRNEVDRYLPLVVEQLREICDEIVILDDTSDDGTTDWLRDHADDQLLVHERPASLFYAHEGRTRQLLLELTLDRRPTHVLNIDCDELLSNPAALRAAVDADPGREVFPITISEIWHADPAGLAVRCDGGWRPHPIPCLWKAPAEREKAGWRMSDRKLACVRWPVQTSMRAAGATVPDVELLHFGWANASDRPARYARYAAVDGGRFHNRNHLQSILWNDRRVQLRRTTWPAPLAPLQSRLLERANRETA